MANINALRDVLDAAGVANLGGLSDPARRPWRYIVNFDDAISTGAALEKQQLTDNGTIFLLKQVHVHLRASSDDDPLALDPSATADTTEAMVHNVRIALRTNTQQWMSDPDGVPASEFAVRPGYARWELDQAVVMGGHTLYAKVRNDSGVSIKARVTFQGLRIEVR